MAETPSIANQLFYDAVNALSEFDDAHPKALGWAVVGGLGAISLYCKLKADSLAEPPTSLRNATLAAACTVTSAAALFEGLVCAGELLEEDPIYPSGAATRSNE